MNYNMDVRLLTRIFIILGITSAFILLFIFIFIITETPSLLLWTNVKPLLIIISTIFAINTIISIFLMLKNLWKSKKEME